jgi:hypothetical protein
VMQWRGGSHWTAYADATTYAVHRSGAGWSRVATGWCPPGHRAMIRLVTGRLLPLLLPNWVERPAIRRHAVARNCR